MKALRCVTLILCISFLSACMENMQGFEFAYGIDGEQVLSSVSSIEEIERGPNGTDTTYTQTVYPFVLVHGLYGFKELFTVEYYYRVAEALEMGGASVYTVNLAKINTNEYRGEQLLAHLKNIKALDGVEKFHLVGHSHGGPAVRYVLSVAPELLASVTSIGGPNVYGTAEPVVEAMSSFWTGAMMQLMANMLGELIDLVEGNEQAHFAIGAFKSVSETGVAEFNALHNHGLPTDWVSGKDYDCSNAGAATSVNPKGIPGNDVLLYSWTGTAHQTNVLDPIDIFNIPSLKQARFITGDSRNVYVGAGNRILIYNL
ncbi:MAG: alpha/beta fold hydrolase, partial [Pseudomonadales bacterium]|nr:alpha/beta fold hydrolase [Pseudomonadales bacterium]